MLFRSAKKLIYAGLLGGLLYGIYKIIQANQQGATQPDVNDELIPPVNVPAIENSISQPPISPDEMPSKVLTPQEEQATQTQITIPDYYDELTYKEYASKQIVAGKAPPMPLLKNFTTAAYYTGAGRRTAYDQRSAQVDQSVFGANFGNKGEAGTRNAESQIHAQTAAFASQDTTPRDASMIPPGGGGVGFMPTGLFGQANNKHTNRATYEAAMADGTGLKGIKSAKSQYKSAYTWWRYRLGEYNYYGGKQSQYANRWRSGANRQGIQGNSRGSATTLGVPLQMRTGGIVYADNGMLVPYQPKGTDTVPAMLTPGEFVVNRKATQANLPLLHKINSGNYNRGGVVHYLSEGTPEDAEDKKLRLQRIREQKRDERIQAAQDRRRAEQERINNLQTRQQEEGSRLQEQRLAQSPAVLARQAASERGEALRLSREQGISPQAAMSQLNAGAAPVAAQAQAQAAAPVQNIPQIAPQMQQRTQQAAQAAFDPRNAGDINRQLTIFGTLLTGVNQVLTQFGATIQQMVGGQQNGNGVNNGGGLDGLGQFTAKFDQFINQLSKLNLPPEINVNGNHKVEVVVNGAQALQELLEGPLADLMKQEVQLAFNKLRTDSEGQIG